MFIRRTRTRSIGEYFTFRLVRSERTGSKVRQRTLLNLGRHFDIAPSDWPVLCRRIDELLAGQLPLPPPALESHAQRITALLLAGEPHRRRILASEPEARLPTRRRRLPGTDSPPLGRRGARRPVGDGPARPAHGGSKHWGHRGASVRTAAIGSNHLRAWPGQAPSAPPGAGLGERSALGELLGVDFEMMGPMRLYRASDALMAHREAIEHPLFDRAMDLFDLHPTVTLYDLTNTYPRLPHAGAGFEGEASGQPNARRGHSKDKRTDCPLLTLGLVLDASGFVRRSQVFAGNVREHHTLAQMLDALHAPRGALVVMDRGIATEDRVRWLREHQYRYLVVSRERTRHFDADAALSIETASHHRVHLHKVLSDDGQEARLYCFSEARAAKERAIVERFAQRFEAALTRLSDGLSKPRTHKRTDQVWQRIGRLKETSRGVAQHYDIALDTDETGERATAVRFTRRPLPGSMLTHPGVYCLRTNQTDWDESTLWRTYFTLTDIEAVFRSLKSELGLRPIYHHKPIRAEGHLFISVIAYQLVQMIRRRLRQTGQCASWTTLRRILEGQQRITATFRRADGRTLHVRKATRAEPSQQAIYEALGINHAPGGIRKTLV